MTHIAYRYTYTLSIRLSESPVAEAPVLDSIHPSHPQGLISPKAIPHSIGQFMIKFIPNHENSGLNLASLLLNWMTDAWVGNLARNLLGMNRGNANECVVESPAILLARLETFCDRIIKNF